MKQNNGDYRRKKGALALKKKKKAVASPPTTGAVAAKVQQASIKPSAKQRKAEAKKKADQEKKDGPLSLVDFKKKYGRPIPLSVFNDHSYDQLIRHVMNYDLLGGTEHGWIAYTKAAIAATKRKSDAYAKDLARSKAAKNASIKFKPAKEDRVVMMARPLASKIDEMATKKLVGGGDISADSCYPTADNIAHSLKLLIGPPPSTGKKILFLF